MSGFVEIGPRSVAWTTDKAGGGPEEGEGKTLQPDNPRVKNHTGKLGVRILENRLCWRSMFLLRTSRNVRDRIEDLIAPLCSTKESISLA